MAIPDVSSVPITGLISLANKVAVVTGGAQGIGRAIATRFAEAGASVVIADVNKASAEDTATELERRFTRRCLGAAVDVADSTAVSELADRTVRELGRLDIWANNAGIYPITPLLELPEEQWDRVLDVNLKGTLLGSCEAARRMIAQGSGGVIINLASVASFRASSLGGTEYVAAKHGVVGLTKSLAAQLGTHGIRVLALAPTTIETPGIQRSREEVASLGGEQVDAQQERPLGRDGVPDDVARVALFCASDLSLLMTGSTLAVDGGTLALL